MEDHDVHPGIISEPWEVIRVLENALATQVSTMKNETQLRRRCHGYWEQHVTVGKYVSVEAGTVLDVRNGGIYIGPGAYVCCKQDSRPHIY